MKRLSSLAILAAFTLAAAAPAVAEISIAAGEKICKAAVSGQEPAPKSVKVNKDETRLSGGSALYAIRITAADGAKSKVSCSVDRTTKETAITPLT